MATLCVSMSERVISVMTIWHGDGAVVFACVRCSLYVT
jgi:hypothetical protein